MYHVESMGYVRGPPTKGTGTKVYCLSSAFTGSTFDTISRLCANIIYSLHVSVSVKRGLLPKTNAYDTHTKKKTRKFVTQGEQEKAYYA